MKLVTTEIEEQKVDVRDLVPGLYVCRLDRPWTDTPFPLQGFLIGNADEVRELARLCRHVFVDTERSIAPDLLRRRAQFDSRDPEALRDTVRYRDSKTVEEELPDARHAHENAAHLVESVLDDVRAGRTPSAAAIDEAVAPIVKSVMRSRDAFFWFESLRKRDSYSYGHAISCCALAAAFGRHLGFPANILTELSTGALLMDIGKAVLPDLLLMRNGPLDDAEWATVRTHVATGLKVVADSGITSDAVHSVVATHHEREDGSGYPHGLIGTSIPLLGRIAGIVDTFDAMTNDRPYRKSLAQHAALQELYLSRNTLFQAELVEQFMSCLGVYPTGSLVELNTGEVAVVMAQNQARRLRPRIMVLTTADKAFDPRLSTFDLMMQSSASDSGEASFIVRALERNAYGLDLTNLFL
jgi:HD-GYP domain-containing protein (c-di-GMP phosphodiesterase class II)